VSRLAPSPAWRARLRAAADAAPLRPRLPLRWRGERIGSVEAEFVERLASRLLLPNDGGWSVQGPDLTATLGEIADRMRVSGLAHAWRDEQLAVRNEQGTQLGTVERAAVRPLGIATHAVHLLATDAQGRHWVQQRAFDKPIDPGLWDTLVGGMVPAQDAMHEALERETWEEAGLQLAQVRDLRHVVQLVTHRPFREAEGGYVVEYLDGFACTLPPGVVLANQDREVAEFRAMSAQEVTQRLEADEFTVDAAMLLLAVHAD
jgi:8-oxo-dGTP pyrophosphatase MutT (NUDIX family)